MIGGYLSRPALVPDPAAEVLVRRPAVPEHAVVAEVVERVDVRAAVRVQVDRVAAVRVLLVRTSRPTPERLSLIDPCGVCVIQIPYGGSPAATQDGMPMKYSTFRSKTWRAVEVVENRRVRLGRDPVQPADLVVRAPRALRHLQAVLVDDRLGNELAIAFTLLIADPLSLGRCRLPLLDERAVEIRPAVAEQVAARTPRARCSPCRARARRRRRRRAAPRSVASGLGEPDAVRVDDLAAAAELGRCAPCRRGSRSAGRSGSPHARAAVISSVWMRAATGNVRSACATMSAPASASVAGHLREAQVVADLEPDPSERRVEDRQLVAGHGEAVDAEERQMRLAVASRSVRPGRRAPRRCGQRLRRVRAGRRRRERRGARHAAASTSVDGPGISSANGIASSALSNM